MTEFCSVQQDLISGEEYRRKVKSHLEDDDLRRVLQGIHLLANYFGNLPVAVNADASLAE